MNPTIYEFQGKYRFLSNFWPCYLEYKGIVYPTAEHAYQAAKFADPAIKERIKNCATPAEAKEFPAAHNLKRDPNWTPDKKLIVMEEILMIKFGGKEPLLTRSLLATEDTPLIEGNTWNDVFWGVCKNTGENNLGKILMKIRAELFRQKEQILLLLESKQNNAAIGQALSFSQRTLYEKMNAFGIPNKEYWIS